MGLDYLNKKVWHPGSMKNIQKVWEVEQVQKEINKKARERAKKLLEEQHNDQLKRIQVEAGLIPRSHLDRMEWMYDWGNKIGQNKTNQDYLTGQKEAIPGQSKDFKHVFQEQITNNKCQDFQLLHEDPMFDIMRQQKQRRDAVMNNPIQMRNIIKEVEKEYLPQDLEERRKKHQSSRRRKSTSSSRSSSSSSDKRRRKQEKKSRKRDRSRDRSLQKQKVKRQNEEQKKSSFKQSSAYKTYLQQRFGSILKTDESGNLKPDYSVHKKKYRTQVQMDEDERRERIQKMRQNAKKLQQMKESNQKKQHSSSEQANYESGVANIRKNMLHGVKQNRNHKRYRKQDSD